MNSTVIKPRLNLSDAVLDIAPPPPPCFLNHASWVEYLKSAAASQGVRGEPKVVALVDGQPKMNAKFPFCADCSQIKSLEMSKQGKCHPNYLVKFYLNETNETNATKEIHESAK